MPDSDSLPSTPHADADTDVADALDAPDPGQQAAEPAGQSRPRRVLVAEDEALIRLDLVELLTEQGYEVVGEAADGEQAVELARTCNPELVVMDIQMPKKNGIDAAKEIAEARIAPVIMLTAFSQRELVEGARDAGAMAYVVKPFEASDLIPAIEIALARFAEIRTIEDEISDLTERLASRKAVDQAKALLQTGLGLNEPEAFRWIQKTAMDLRKSMREVAEGVISHANQGGANSPMSKKAKGRKPKPVAE